MIADLRTLLIDCRIALRATLSEFDVDPISKRLEQAIHELTRAALPPASASTKSSAQQVALAWQTASRGLRLSHPEIYQALSERVMALLDDRELVEPVDELLQLEAQVKKLEAQIEPYKQRLEEMRKRAGDNQIALDQLRRALQDAAPRLCELDDPQALALARIQHLRESGGAIGPAGAGTPARAEEPLVPTQAILRAVIAGERSFSKEQREWAVGEALGITGWKFTPLELLDKGEPWLAQCLLEAEVAKD